MDIFKKKKLYPDEKTPLKKHFSLFTDVFVGLIPFFKVKDSNGDIKSSKCILSLEEAQEKDDIFKYLNDFEGTICSSNECYPDDEEILRNGKKVRWEEIIDNTSINNFKELNKALMTSIGAYKEELQRHDLLDILNNYTEQNNIWHPTEGTFDVFTKKAIYETLKLNGSFYLEVRDEFYENIKGFNFNELDVEEFVNKIDFKDYFIYSVDRSILFSIDWDYFFFFIAIDSSKIDKNDIENNFEGFWADDNTTHLWTWEAGEIENLLYKNNKWLRWWKKIFKL